MKKPYVIKRVFEFLHLLDVRFEDAFDMRLPLELRDEQCKRFGHVLQVVRYVAQEFTVIRAVSNTAICLFVIGMFTSSVGIGEVPMLNGSESLTPESANGRDSYRAAMTL